MLGANSTHGIKNHRFAKHALFYSKHTLTVTDISLKDRGQSRQYTHTYTHAHAHTYTHAHAHTYTHAHTQDIISQHGHSRCRLLSSTVHSELG